MTIALLGIGTMSTREPLNMDALTTSTAPTDFLNCEPEETDDTPMTKGHRDRHGANDPNHQAKKAKRVAKRRKANRAASKQRRK